MTDLEVQRGKDNKRNDRTAVWCRFAERSGGGGGVISEDSILFTSTHKSRTKTAGLISIDSYCSQTVRCGLLPKGEVYSY